MNDLIRSSWLPWAIAALWLSACKLHTDYSNTQYRCDEAQRCPVGQECVAGYCQIAEPADGGVDSGEPPLPSSCGTVGILQDDFEDQAGSAKLWWDWNSNGFEMQHTAGDLLLHLPADRWNAHGGYSSQKKYMFAGGSVSAEVVDVTPGIRASTILEVSTEPDDDWVLIRHENGTLYLEYELNGVLFQPATLAYSKTEHRWWQLREQGGVVYWETSPDGETWTAHASASSAPFAGLVRAHIWARTERRLDEPSTSRIASINGERPSEERWCPAETLQDGFDDREPSYLWEIWQSNGCTMEQRDGELVFTHPADKHSECNYHSILLYDMTESSVTVQVPRISPDVVARFYVYLPHNEDFLKFRHVDGELHCVKQLQGNTTTALRIPYDPDEHQWWRLRSESGTVYWETSADRETWNILTSHGSPAIPLDTVHLGLWTESEAGGEIAFDHYNIAP